MTHFLLLAILSSVMIVAAATPASTQASSISGNISYFDGTPAVGLDVYICSQSAHRCHTTESGLDGSFTVPVTSDTFTISLRLEHHTLAYYNSPDTGSVTFVRSRREFLSFSSLSSRTPLNMTLPRIYTVTGLLLDTGGHAASQARVAICSFEPHFRECNGHQYPNDEGRFHFSVPAGSYYLPIWNGRGGGGVSGFYSRHSDGHFTSTNRELSLIAVPSPQASVDDIVLPGTTAIQLVIANLEILDGSSLFFCKNRPGAHPIADCTYGYETDPSDHTRITFHIPTPTASDEGYMIVWTRGDLKPHQYYTKAGTFSKDIAQRLKAPAHEWSGRTLTLPERRLSSSHAIDITRGWNRVGWTAGRLSISTLCLNPAVHAVIVTAHRGSLQATPLSNDCDGEEASSSVQYIQTGDIVWIWSDVEDATTARFLTEEPDWRWIYEAPLPAGSLVVPWMGPDETPLGLIQRGLGLDATVSVIPSVNTTEDDALSASHGDILHLRLPSARRWSTWVDTKHETTFLGDAGRADADDIDAGLEAAQSFYWNAYGLAATDVEVLYSTNWLETAGYDNWGEGWLWGMTLPSADIGLIVHEYYHIIQNRLADDGLMDAGTDVA